MHGTGDSYATFDLPARLARLEELARNLWWSWQPDAVALWKVLAGDAWDALNHNPIRVLRALTRADLERLAGDAGLVSHYNQVLQAFDAYMHPTRPPWFQAQHADSRLLVAYFCAEYGLHESLPIYSGGLGVLAGDHCKTASDLGLPFLAIGLWYTEGYFRQTLDPSGQQIAASDHVPQVDTPLTPAGVGGADLLINVPIAGRTVAARVWRLQVGRVPIYLLDPDVESNADADRALCTRLYGGDRETRIAQEVLLGVGGVMAVRALGIQPTRWHMNEGHAAFMGLERIREMVQSGTDFTDAWPIEAEASVFTTHTPVPAGNEVFKNGLVVRYLQEMAAGMGLDDGGMLALAREAGAPDDTFAMTALALRLTHRANGVSKLHGAVARSMWQKQFDVSSMEQTPITSVTNGVHTGSWVAPELAALFSTYLGADWMQQVDDQSLWDGIALIPDAELWNVHLRLKQRLLTVIKTRRFNGDGDASSRALTIGFARRFATYKRATLFFHDVSRALRILSNPERPVSIIFAGKAHPADSAGQAYIRAIANAAREHDLPGSVLFLPGYDIALARTLVQGVDLWLNNPERPQEASGTSGQKAALNGIPNCSIRDGWWDEGFNGRNGWAFGGDIGDDKVDSEQLYEVLEREVVPAFFDRDQNDVPARWVAIMKESIRTLAPAFSAQRMVKEYTERLYL